MAIDEVLLALVGEGRCPATLRFYGWQSPWVSLGTGQPVSDLDAEATAARGWGVLRRSSGGTAVLHQGQLGYAVILPTNHSLWDGDLAGSYQRLAEPLALGLARINVPAEPAPPSRKAEFVADAPPIATRVCFSALGPYELLDRHGRKIIGNSQIRRRAAALQHGTLQVSGSQIPIADVLSNTGSAERADLVAFLSSHVGSVGEAAGRCLNEPEIVEELQSAFEEALGIRLDPAPLSADERRLADELVRTKYGNQEWTLRR